MGMLHSLGTQRSLSSFKENLAGLFLPVVPCRVTLAVFPVQGEDPGMCWHHSPSSQLQTKTCWRMLLFGQGVCSILPAELPAKSHAARS